MKSTHNLVEGTRLCCIMGSDHPAGSYTFITEECPVSAKANAETITIVMECGQMGMVPWAAVVTKEGREIMVNVQQAETLELIVSPKK